MSFNTPFVGMERPKPSRHLSRRRVSAPATMRPKNQDAPVETLFFHPSVKVVAFTAPVKALSSDPGTAREEAGTVPSHSHTERTIAVGPLRIYRAPGSVAFLSCGAALQPILPKSQCWCIDDKCHANYVLQVRRPTFWRIELPVSTENYQIMASELKEVWGQVLQFEKTYCPFQRTFSVDLPEQPETPVKLKPWTPKHLPSAIDFPAAEKHGGVTESQSPKSLAQPSHDAHKGSTSSFRSLNYGSEHEERSSPSREEVIDEPQTLGVSIGSSITSSEQPESMGFGQTLATGSAHAADGAIVRHNPPPATVVSMVDDIHDRFGRFTSDSFAAYQAVSTDPKSYSNAQQTSSRLRRHSFDSFMKPAIATDEHSLQAPLFTSANDGLILGRPMSRPGRSLHANQATKSISALGELSRKPSDPSLGSPGGRDSKLQSFGRTMSIQVPSPANVDRSSSYQGQECVNNEMPKASRYANPSYYLSGVDYIAGSSTPSRNISKDLPQPEDTKQSTTSGMRLKQRPSNHAVSTSQVRSSPRGRCAYDSAQAPAARKHQGLPTNIVSMTYDGLLLPLAYLIALILKVLTLILKVLARILSFRRRDTVPYTATRQNGDQVPAFLQYSEDELTE